MQKEINGLVGLGMLIGFGPALILKALVNAGGKQEDQEPQDHGGELEVAKIEEVARKREVAIEARYMAQDNRSKSEIEALKLKIQELEKDKECLNKKVKHLEHEGEVKSEIIAEKNQGKKFDHLVGLMK